MLIAVALDVALGDPPNRYHPVAWLGRVIAAGRCRLARGSRARLFVTGALLVSALVAMAAVIGAIVEMATARLGLFGVIVNALVLKSTVAIRGLGAAASNVRHQLERGDLEAARSELSRDLVSRPTSELDPARIASATVESVAENLTDAIVAPLIFYVVFGLPGALAYRVINTADAMVGYREGGLEWFGKAAARWDDFANFVPARIAAFALALAAPLCGASARGALRVMWRDARRTASPNAGTTMAAMAGALGVSLEKVDAYRLGEGAWPGPREIGKSVTLMATATALVAAALVTAQIVLG